MYIYAYASYAYVKYAHTQVYALCQVSMRIYTHEYAYIYAYLISQTAGANECSQAERVQGLVDHEAEAHWARDVCGVCVYVYILCHK